MFFLLIYVLSRISQSVRLQISIEYRMTGLRRKKFPISSDVYKKSKNIQILQFLFVHLPHTVYLCV
jgi:hypothetical protein